jgi:O-antigen ligase
MHGRWPVAFYEVATGNHFAYALDDRQPGADFGALPFASVFFGNFNDYSTFICLALPMLAGTIEDPHRVRFRWLNIACLAGAISVLLVNLTRLAIIFVGCLLLYYAFTRSAVRRSPITWVAVASAGLFAASSSEQATALIEFGLFKFTSLASNDESAGERAALLAAIWESLRQTYGLGLGVGALENYLVTVHPDLIANPHNFVAELAANFGLLSAGIFIAFLGYLWLAVRRGALPPELKTPILFSLPFMPVIGAISSQGIGYTYWWIWLASVTFIAAVSAKGRFQSASDTRRHRSPHPPR